MGSKPKCALRTGLLTALLFGYCPVDAAKLNDTQAVPHLDSVGQAAYRAFLEAGVHRAFAIAPGGAWAWSSDAVSADRATRDARQTCQQLAGRPCVTYAIDDQLAFNTQQWPTLWGPYPTRAVAAKAKVGPGLGNRFFDLTFKNPAGKPSKLSDLRGKVLVLHFWASWCPPCRTELPQLQKLQQQLASSTDGVDVQWVLLQVREDFSTASRWVRQQQLSLPLHDSGVPDRNTHFLTLADGQTLADRTLASTFPSTYVLDKHGVVVFAHSGPIDNWLPYLPFLQDVAGKSGK